MLAVMWTTYADGSPKPDTRWVQSAYPTVEACMEDAKKNAKALKRKGFKYSITCKSTNDLAKRIDEVNEYIR